MVFQLLTVFAKISNILWKIENRKEGVGVVVGVKGREGEECYFCGRKVTRFGKMVVVVLRKQREHKE